MQQSNYNPPSVDYSSTPRMKTFRSQNNEHGIDQYNEYSSRTNEGLSVPPQNPVHHQLYSVSQRIPTVSSSYSNLCDSGFNSHKEQQIANFHPQSTNANGTDWERTTISTLDTLNDSNADNLNEFATSNSTGSQTPKIRINTSQESGPVIQTCVYLPNQISIIMEIEDTPNATCDLIQQSIVSLDELNLSNKHLSMQIFALWMSSPLLELQLKPTHKAYEIRQCWPKLLEQYSHASFTKQQRDEPQIKFQRNVFFPLHSEEKIKDQHIIEMLYEEARYNIIEGRYPCEVSHYIMLGGIQARIELGHYNAQIHSTQYFREEQSKYLPYHVRKSTTWQWLPISAKNSAEVRLLDQYKRIPATANNRKLMRKYLEFCWTLPFYGSAFFEGQIEQPVRGLLSLMTHQDFPVLVAINSWGIHVIDDTQCSLLLALRYHELSWEYARPSKENDSDCLPCLFLQFLVVENGTTVSKILQVFSRQASLMDTLICSFVNRGGLTAGLKTSDEYDGNNKPLEPIYNANTDNGGITQSSLNLGVSTNSSTQITNKLSRLTLATFDEDGHCIGQMGSWSFSF